MYAVNAFNGALIWQQNLSELTGLTGTGVIVNVTVSRSTPTVDGDLLIVGIYGPAIVIAVARSTGRLVWSTKLDPRPRVLITGSGTAYMGLVTFRFCPSIVSFLLKTYLFDFPAGRSM